MDLPMHGDGAGTVTVADDVFADEYKPGLVHQVVVAYMAAGRSGTKAQKTRRQVSGGNSKPFRQKGTGRARAGSSRSPLWRGGGKVFAARPRSYEQKVNRKMYRGAMRSIVSELARLERLAVVPSISVEAPKTKLLKQRLAELGLSDVLIVTETWDETLALAARNLPGVDVTTAPTVDPVSLIAFSHVLVTEGGLKKLSERLA